MALCFLGCLCLQLLDWWGLEMTVFITKNNVIPIKGRSLGFHVYDHVELTPLQTQRLINQVKDLLGEEKITYSQVSTCDLDNVRFVGYKNGRPLVRFKSKGK